MKLGRLSLINPNSCSMSVGVRARLARLHGDALAENLAVVWIAQNLRFSNDGLALSNIQGTVTQGVRHADREGSSHESLVAGRAVTGRL